MSWLLRCLASALMFPIAASAQTLIAPVPFAGQGTMTVTTASQTVSGANVTLTTANSVAFPPTGVSLPTGMLRVKLQVGASGNLTVCWRGGTCTATNGEVLAAGEARTVSLPSFAGLPPTMFGSASVAVELEW